LCRDDASTRKSEGIGLASSLPGSERARVCCADARSSLVRIQLVDPLREQLMKHWGRCPSDQACVLTEQVSTRKDFDYEDV